MGMPSPPTRPRLPWACSRCEGGQEDEQVWACRCVSWYKKGGLLKVWMFYSLEKKRVKGSVVMACVKLCS